MQQLLSLWCLAAKDLTPFDICCFCLTSGSADDDSYKRQLLLVDALIV
jgi:hypothetical protein